MLNSIVKSFFDGYHEAKKDEKRDWQYKELEQTPFLFSSNYLDEMYEGASDKQEYENILEHLYRHNATEIDSYAEIEQKIINKYWR
ncbi:hypothetical protein KZX50_00430 [Bacillus infantis]|uniref:hypothetical protein n=1 Tax=Bacillus infantis TaxID=324767 RepID=UPI002004C848|nr:hypothetical protein [Bacillus infantis]MCK6203913.1 hypothetical protein [Bacillus infantis]